MARKRSFPWFRTFIAVAAAIAIIPVGEVVLIRFFNPPLTPLMLLRRLESFVDHKYRGEIHYRWAPIAQVPDDYLKGVWQIEDSRFFSHDGFDWIEMEVAIRRAQKKHQPIRGVSTITNQCARSLFL